MTFMCSSHAFLASLRQFLSYALKVWWALDCLTEEKFVTAVVDFLHDSEVRGANTMKIQQCELGKSPSPEKKH